MGLPSKQGFILGFLFLFSSFLSCCLAFNVDLNISYLVLTGSTLDKDNSFGYSVGMYHRSSGLGLEPRILVGSPTGLTSHAERRGDFYECDNVGKQPNKEQRCSHQVADSGDVDSTKIRKGQWLGASLSTRGESQVVCAPRYTETGTKGYEIFGKCFLYTNGGKQESIPCKSLGDFSYGQAGISVSITKDKAVVFGAPGGRAGNGAILLQRSTNLQNIEKTKSTGKGIDFYLGYSVTSGNFDNDVSTEEVAGGMPRGEVTGKVLIYNHDLGQNIQSLYPPTKVKNAREYIAFGASICAVDLNSDGVDDILVGAPFYGVKGDEGRVYVFINQKSSTAKPIFKLSSGENDLDPGLKGDNQEGSRFGVAIAAAGDLNFDGYQDVIIGAPLGGPDGNGAIFIYHGSRTGINEEIQQKITASEMNSWTGKSFRQFGYAIAGGTDTDANEYPDIVVGAWGSNNVLLLRTKPVMDIDATLTLSRTEIPVDNFTNFCPNDNRTQCLNAMACFKYNGKGITGNHEIEINFELDPEPSFKRVYFLSGTKKTYSVTKRFTITNNESCINFTDIHVEGSKQLRPSSDNIINFKASYKLIYEPDCYTNKLCPVLATTPKPFVEEKATLVFNCTDNTCDYDLQISISSKQNDIVIGGKVETLLTEVILLNKEEKAYNPEVTVYHDSTLQYEKIIVLQGRVEKRVISSGNESTTELFRVLGAINSGKQVKFQLQYSTRKVSGDKPTLSIKVVARGTSGKEVNKNNNNATFTIKVRRDISFFVRGTSVPKALTYPIKSPQIPTGVNGTDYSKLNVSSFGLQMNVTFVLTNNGRSPLSSIELKINYPYRENGNDSEIQYIVYPLDVKPATCVANVLNPEKLDVERVFHSREKRDVTLDTRRRKGETITCTVDKLLTGDSFTVEFFTLLWLPTLTKLHPNNIILKIDSEATYRNSLANNDKTVHKKDLVIKLTPQNVAGKRKTTPIWVIIVSVLGGILLLALLFFALFKFGFFKRNRPPKDISSPQTDDAPQQPEAM